MCFSTHLQKMFIFLRPSHNANTLWTRVVIMSCYHLLPNPKSSLSTVPQIPCFVLFALTVNILQNKVLLLKACHSVKGYGSIPASLSPSGSRAPSLFGGQYPLPHSCRPVQPADKNTREWALPGCITLDLSIQKAAPKLGEKLSLIEKRGHFRSLLHPWHDNSGLPMDAEYLTNWKD